MANLIESQFIKRGITATILISSIYNIIFTLPSCFVYLIVPIVSTIAYNEFRNLHLEDNTLYSIQNAYNLCILLYTYYTAIFQSHLQPFVLTNIILIKSISLIISPVELYKNIAEFYQDLYGVIYTIYLPSYFILLYDTSGLQLWYDIIAVGLFDIGGYIVGKYIGNTQFSKYSPKKSIEGVLGGVVMCSSFCYFTGAYSLNKVCLLMFLSLIGDLFESYIKRSNNKKDSGTIMYGHGGMLDRLDGYIFTMYALHTYNNI